MPFIKTTRPEDANDAVTAMYARQQSAWGYVPNYAKVFCYRPEVMARWGQLLAEIKRPMELRTFELVTFVAAHELRNTACTLAHGKALREFFSDEQIVAIAAGRYDHVLDDAEAARPIFCDHRLHQLYPVPPLGAGARVPVRHQRLAPLVIRPYLKRLLSKPHLWQ